jgi:hypothetical protein
MHAFDVIFDRRGAAHIPASLIGHRAKADARFGGLITLGNATATDDAVNHEPWFDETELDEQATRVDRQLALEPANLDVSVKFPSALTGTYEIVSEGRHIWKGSPVEWENIIVFTRAR